MKNLLRQRFRVFTGKFGTLLELGEAVLSVRKNLTSWSENKQEGLVFNIDNNWQI